MTDLPAASETTPDAVVDAFLAAWRAGDFEAARAQVADGVVVHARTKVEESQVEGFDAFLEMYARRRQKLNITSEHPVQRSSGERHVSVLTRMREAQEVWYSLSVYRVTDGVVGELWLHEPF